MTHSTTKKLTEPLDEPEREFLRRRRAAWHQQQNESLSIAGRNLFDNEASYSNNGGAEPLIPSKTIWEHSLPTDGATRDTSRLRFFHFTLSGKAKEWYEKILATQITTWDQLVAWFLDYFFPIGSAHEADECHQNRPPELVCLSGGGIYDDPSLLRFYQNDDVPPWGNSRQKESKESSPDWTIRSKFEDELASFMLEKKFHTNRLGEMLDQHRKEMHEQFSQILSVVGENRTPESNAPTFAITTRSGTSTRNPPFLNPLEPKILSHDEGTVRKEVPEGKELDIKKDEEDEQLLSIFKQIHINLPFLEAMIHMPKGPKVLKDLLSHKEKLEKVASSVKLSEECSAIIQRSLPQKEGNPGSFTLPCLIGPLIVKNALDDLGASINLMPHSLFHRLGISKMKQTKMSIQLAVRSIKYPIGVCENLLVKINKFIFPVDFVVLEMDEDELVPIILGRHFLATARAIIDVHEGKLSLRVKNETVNFNIEKTMKSKYSRDDYL
ncbi:putative reverse transcriptase domain-containing protein [Tanacetum coccineum]